MRVLIASCVFAAGLHGAGLALVRQDLQLTQALGIGGSIAVGDFNGDGRPDLVAGMESGVAVMLNLGRATFGPAISTGIVQPPIAPFAIADFNHDGKLDVAAWGQIALGRGDGTFEPPRPMSPMWFAAEAADFNGDGLSDLAAVGAGPFGDCCDQARLLIFLGNGDGSFRSADLGQIRGGYKPLVADFNRDGKPDLAVSLGGAVAIFLGNGDGSFKTLDAIPLPAGSFASTLLAADLNGDKIPDLVTLSQVFLGRGDGSFQPPVSFSSSSGEAAFALADLDADGLIDIATLENRQDQGVTDRIRIFSGRGDGTFSAPVEHVVGWGPQLGVAADFDGDGHSDLLVPNWRSNTLTVLSTRNGTQGTLQRSRPRTGQPLLPLARSQRCIFRWEYPRSRRLRPGKPLSVELRSGLTMESPCGWPRCCTYRMDKSTFRCLQKHYPPAWWTLRF